MGRRYQKKRDGMGGEMRRKNIGEKGWRDERRSK